MAPLSPDSTKRWFLDYTTCSTDHTLEMRSVDSVTDIEASAAFDVFLTAIESQIYEMTVTGMRFADVGSNITLPATFSGALTYGSDDGPKDHGAVYVNFIGRSTGGRRVRAGVFGGRNFSLAGDYRVSDADSTVVGDGVSALTGNPDVWEAIDGRTVIWHRYFNIGTNAYWRNKIR